jgi:hypothetical protein
MRFTGVTKPTLALMGSLVIALGAAGVLQTLHRREELA